MNTVNQIGPWVTLVLFSLLILFFAGFYITKYIQEKKSSKVSDSSKVKSYEKSAFKPKVKTALSK